MRSPILARDLSSLTRGTLSSSPMRSSAPYASFLSLKPLRFSCVCGAFDVGMRVANAYRSPTLKTFPPTGSSPRCRADPDELCEQDYSIKS